MPTREKSGFINRHRRLLIGGGALFATSVLLIGAANAWVLAKGNAPAYSAVSAASHAETAIVLGALVNRDGTMSTMLADRVDQAAALWKAGKVDSILVSGDHGSWRYDEPDTMKNALIGDGVPDEDIFTDHAGFNTRASMVRAHDVFDVTDALIVTQGFHMRRALYLAEAAGLEAEGVTSDLHAYGGQGVFSSVREVASRLKAVAEVALDRPVTGGPDVPIDGPASASRGPAPPRDTPAAGAPDG